jgi:hypothetical protein
MKKGGVTVTEAPPEVTVIIQKLSDEFDNFCEDRHTKGADKYGPFKFLGADVIQETLEEIADMANYARYQYIKLRMLQVRLSEDPRIIALANEEDEAVIGIESFRSN